MNGLTLASLRPAGLVQAAQGGVGTSRPPHIVPYNNAFVLVDSTGNKKQLPPMILNMDGQQQALTAVDIIVTYANPKPSKVYWDPNKPYSPTSVDPPLCWSDNGFAPSMQALTPQSATCIACPHNEIGSAVSKMSGVGIKACRDSKKLAVIVPDQHDGIAYLFQVTPGSFKAWTTYLNWLKGQRTPEGNQPDLSDVVTRVTFAPPPAQPNTLKFEPVALVAEGTPHADQLIAAWQRMDTLAEIVGKNDQPIQGLPGQAAGVNQFLSGTQQQPTQFQPLLAGSGTPHANQLFAASTETLEQAEQKRKRRTKAEMEAARAAEAKPAFTSGLQQTPAVGAPVNEDIPPFLRRPTPQPVAPAPSQPTNTGLATPTPAPSDLQAKLAAAFNLPLTK